jgi:hypothetical protein
MCENGNWGSFCIPCSTDCNDADLEASVSRKCDQETGKCLHGCRPGRSSSYCGVNSAEDADSEDSDLTTTVIAIVVPIVIVVLCLVVCCCVSSAAAPDDSSSSANTDAGTEKELVVVTREVLRRDKPLKSSELGTTPV